MEFLFQSLFRNELRQVAGAVDAVAFQEFSFYARPHPDPLSGRRGDLLVAYEPARRDVDQVDAV